MQAFIAEDGNLNYDEFLVIKWFRSPCFVFRLFH